MPLPGDLTRLSSWSSDPHRVSSCLFAPLCLLSRDAMCPKSFLSFKEQLLKPHLFKNEALAPAPSEPHIPFHTEHHPSLYETESTSISS